MKNKLKTMTVGELKEYLGQFPDSALVVFGYPSHDHWRTELVGKINLAEYGSVEYTAYHQCFKLIERDEAEEKGKKGQEVLVLGSKP